MLEKLISSLIITLLFAFTTSNVWAKNLESSLKDNSFYITDDVFNTKKFNVDRDDYLTKVYGANWEKLYKRNSMSSLNANKIESLFKKEDNTIIKFPKYFGGMYIDDEDNLVVQIVKNLIPQENDNDYLIYKKILNIVNNKIEYVDNSYNDIYVTYEKMNELFLNNKFDNYVRAFYIDVMNNKIVVELLNNSDNEQKEFKEKIFNFDFIEFVREKGATVSLNVGASNGMGGSVGYRARKTSSGQGFVTHGHGVNVNQVISGIGKVKNKRFSGKVDASWVDTKGYSATPTNNWQAYPPYIMPTLSLSTTIKTSFVVGERVGRIGKTTKHRTGKITKVSWSGLVPECSTCPEIEFTNMVLTDVYQLEGDSGGIVYYTQTSPLPNTPERHLTCGIGVFKTSNNKMIFSRADYINTAFGLSRY